MTALVWACAAACVAGAAALLARRRRAAPSLPLAEPGALAAAARRSRLLWGGLAAAAVAVALTVALEARGRPGAEPLLEPGADAVVVVDLSSSTRSASPAIARVLRGLTDDPRRRLGLVVFSNAAYEALPPSTPADGLAGWLDRFERARPGGYPWASFSSGTTISSGLALARRLLRRDRVAQPHVVLVSDLVDTPSDLTRLEATIARYQREGIDLRIVAVRAKAPRRVTAPAFQLPNATFVERAAAATVDPAHAGPSSRRAVLLVALVAALGLLAALHELSFHPLAWRART